MIIVDAHQHYWEPSRGDYGWLDDAPAQLRHAFLPQDLDIQRIAAGVAFSILVQAAPSEAETRYLYALAQLETGVLGVVGWVDLEAPDAEARIDALASDGSGLLCGLRPMAQDHPDHDWLARSSLDHALAHMVEHDLAFDALVTEPQWSSLLMRLDRQPGLRVILDHGGKPPAGAAGFRRWCAWIDELAAIPTVHCKLSGLLTELASTQPDSAIEPHVAYLFERFGPFRLAWGSDWPVLTLRSDYNTWLRQATALTERYAPGHLGDVFAGNALRFYGRNQPSLNPCGEMS
ncbi:amidohydrolase family protein [Dyella sp. A6]|uniref:amidohydrolase family protein n=1 Tax=Dyella aluminiiresistens TaxID=3069105 RepID=UPI002E79A100|nr:amidohydrolase family protein [Dyella sp. A6]